MKGRGFSLKNSLESLQAHPTVTVLRDLARVPAPFLVIHHHFLYPRYGFAPLLPCERPLHAKQVQKVSRRNVTKVKLKHEEDSPFHFQDGIFGDEGISLGEEDKIGDFGGGDFLVLGGDEEGGDGEQVQVGGIDGGEAKGPVEDANRQEGCILFEIKFFTNSKQPLNELCPIITTNLTVVFQWQWNISLLPLEQ